MGPVASPHPDPAGTNGQMRQVHQQAFDVDTRGRQSAGQAFFPAKESQRVNYRLAHRMVGWSIIF
jgi:hypothetical protein